MHGEGKFVFENGYYYIGKFCNDIFEGKGKICDKNGNIIYDGEFINKNLKEKGNIFMKMMKFIQVNGKMV